MKLCGFRSQSDLKLHEQAAVALTEEQQETLAAEAAAMVQRLAALAQRHQALLSNASSLKPQSPVARLPDAAKAVWPTSA